MYKSDKSESESGSTTTFYQIFKVLIPLVLVERKIFKLWLKRFTRRICIAKLQIPLIVRVSVKGFEKCTEFISKSSEAILMPHHENAEKLLQAERTSLVIYDLNIQTII